MATLVSTVTQPTTPLPANTTPYQVSGATADLLGTNADTANQLYAAPNVTPADATSAVNELFQSQIQATQDQYQAQAQNEIATGDEAEAQQYLLASGAADQNARLAAVSSELQSYQAERTTNQTLGSQQADIAGAGFGGGATAMFLARDSAQQGALTQQLINTQGEITAGGFEQQSDAAQAEASAAEAAGAAANTLAGSAAATGSALTTNALNNAMALVNTAGTGTGASNTGPNATYNGVSASEAAEDARFMGYTQTPIGWVYQGNGSFGGQGGGVTVSPQGQQAAKAFIQSGQPAPSGPVGGLKVTQDTGAAELTATGLG